MPPELEDMLLHLMKGSGAVHMPALDFFSLTNGETDSIFVR